MEGTFVLIQYNELIMINTVVMCRIPTNETADEMTGPHSSGDTTCPVNRKY